MARKHYEPSEQSLEYSVTKYSTKEVKNTAIYKGAFQHSVTKDGRTLNPKPSQIIFNHSPTGFSWGYSGSGPAQLALALLLDATGNPEKAAILHQEFKRDVVATWNDQWEITTEQILEWVKKNE